MNMNNTTTPESEQKKYKIIYADPPWSYTNKSLNRGGAERHYKTTGINELCAMNVNEIADKNSVMFMWVTFPMLQKGLDLLVAWGFEYKTNGFTWVKTNKINGGVYMGMGGHTRSNAEICIIGVKGKGVKRVNCGIRQTQLHARTEHSSKPLAFRDDIEKLYGINAENTAEFPRLEMFARYAADGWDVFGNEAPDSIKINVKGGV